MAEIINTHPQIFTQPYRTMATELFETHDISWIASFSSLEHRGLRRYGDELNPDGDHDALQQAW
jgi:Caenorhabditis protein of unknown function, DUF268